MLKTRWIVLAVPAIAAAGWLIMRQPARPLRAAAAPVQSADDLVKAETEIRERDIGFYERRVGEDSLGAIDRSKLAGLYMQRARVSGSMSDYDRAEALARRSLVLRTDRNEATFGILVGALLARHAFAEALIVARRAVMADSLSPANLALAGEVELETGDYEAANRHFSSVRFDGRDFSVGARLARWRELTGRSDAARRLLRHAIRQVDERDDLSRETVAWFHYRLGELELRLGNLDTAAASYQRGLRIFPGDHRILGGLARLSAARGEWSEAVEYGSRAIAIQLDPATLGTMSEAYAALGDTAQAAQFAKAMAVSALKQPGPIHRAWGLFLLDHGTPRDAARVLARARDELRTRKDVYGYDLLAWALHRRGRNVEARAAMERALSQHTEDPLLQRHAAIIAPEVLSSAIVAPRESRE
jgi:tetratricopeptide (TPR) repeat protein